MYIYLLRLCENNRKRAGDVSMLISFARVNCNARPEKNWVCLRLRHHMAAIEGFHVVGWEAAIGLIENGT